MEHRILGATGLSVSALSLGASPFGGMSFGSCKRCPDTALGLGINLVDRSPHYGLTKAETMLGRTSGRTARLVHSGDQSRALWPQSSRFRFSASRVKRSVDESLACVGMEYEHHPVP